MRIIKRKELKEKDKFVVRKKCRCCRSKIEITYEDIKYGAYDYLWDCPVCGKTNRLGLFDSLWYGDCVK